MFLYRTSYGFVEDSKQRATCEDLLYIYTRVRQTIYWRIRATNFPYSLHNKFGGFTARKLVH
jgi:hypothetical protein